MTITELLKQVRVGQTLKVELEFEGGEKEGRLKQRS